MSTFFSGVWVVLALELRQRVRGVAWYVLIGIFAALVAVVTFVVWYITVGFGGVDDATGGGIFSTIIYFVLLLGTLVAPALSGNAINGDREAGTLATTQVTLITTGQLVIGKFLAAWITALGFLVASLPFLIIGLAVGGVAISTIVISTLVLAIELGVVAAVGVGLSGILNKPLFSVVVTYLVVAALSVGTLITFGLAGAATQSTARTTYVSGLTYSELTGDALTCTEPSVSEFSVPRFDYYWGILAANHAIRASRELRRRELHEARLEARLVEARLESLQRQLHPHFVFNTTNDPRAFWLLCRHISVENDGGFRAERYVAR